MDPDRWRRIEEIYQSAAERPPEEREAFLVAACDGDEELRGEVESLLAQQSIDTPLDHPACEVAGGLPSAQTLERASDLAGLRLSHYEIQQKLGEGGMGVVYKARDIRLGRTVALKVLPAGKLADPDRKRRFVQEARAASALNHPHIVTVHDIDQSDGVEFIAMEYVEGRTLGELIGRKGLKLGEALKYAIQIADALAQTHSVSVVHRDLKPGNVMVTRDGRVKVLDFGLAKLTEPATVSPEDASLADPPSTEFGLIVGTLGYMSPEQAQGKKVDARSDIFSFGTVLYEMLTGRRLFARDSQAQTLAAILDSEPPPLPAEIPRELERVVARCLRKDVDHRYQHMDDVKIALEELKEDSDSGRLSAPSSVPPRSQRKAWMLAAAALALVLVGAGGWYLGRSRTETASRPSMRFTINLPAEAPLAPSGSMPIGMDRPALALSPDGTRLAYVALMDGTTRICVRDMSTGKVEPLAQTEGGHSPFFSADGASFGFFADDKLKRIPASGGSVAVLADAPQPFGGAWGADGAIYFSRMGNDGLCRISEDGGAVQVVSKVILRMPELLPHGRGLLANSRGGIVHLVGTSTPRYLTSGTGARYSPTGHLLYSQQGRLMAAPLDLSKIAFTGPPVTLFDDLRSSAYGVAQFTFALNGTLVYAPGHPANRSTFVWVDRKGRARPTGLPERHYLTSDLSPDGRRLAATVETRELEEAEIWVQDLKHGTSFRLTPRNTVGERTEYAHPHWTPDGRKLIYLARQGEKWRLLSQAADASGRVVELWSGGSAAGPLPVAYLYPMSFTPDGLRMMVFGQRPGRTMDIFLLHLNSEGMLASNELEPFLETPFAESFGQISPDGRWVVYASDQSGRWEIYVTSYPKAGATYPISVSGGHKPIWNPAASEILYRIGTKMYAVDVTLSPTFRAGTPRLLFEGPYPAIPGFDWDISPDGKELLLLENKDVLKPVTTLTVVTDFFDELRRRAPSGSAQK